MRTPPTSRARPTWPIVKNATITMTLVVAATACARDEARQPGSDPSVALDVDQTQLRSLARDEIFSIDNQIDIAARRLESEAACLEDRGFEVVRPTTDQLREEFQNQSNIERVKFGIPADYNGDLGITRLLDLSNQASGLQPVQEYGTEFLEASFGDPSSNENQVEYQVDSGVISFSADGCIGISYVDTIGTGRSLRLYTQTAAKIQSQVDLRLAELPEIADALLAWKQCANEHGSDLAAPDESATRITDAYTNKDPNAALTLERQLADLMQTCESTTNLLEMVIAAQPGVEDVIVAQNRQEVDDLLELIDTTMTS